MSIFYDKDQEQAYKKRAKQYKRVKIIILLVSFLVAAISGVIVVSNGKIFKLLGIKNYYEGLNIFFMIMYVLIIIGIQFFLFLLISSAVSQLIAFLKDKLGK